MYKRNVYRVVNCKLGSQIKKENSKVSCLLRHHSVTQLVFKKCPFILVTLYQQIHQFHAVCIKIRIAASVVIEALYAFYRTKKNLC